VSEFDVLSGLPRVSLTEIPEGDKSRKIGRDLSTHRGELAWRSSRNTGRNDRRAKRNRYCGGVARLRVLDGNIRGSGRACGDLVEPSRVHLNDRCITRGERQAVRGV